MGEVLETNFDASSVKSGTKNPATDREVGDCASSDRSTRDLPSCVWLGLTGLARPPLILGYIILGNFVIINFRDIKNFGTYREKLRG